MNAGKLKEGLQNMNGVGGSLRIIKKRDIL